jgi:hypothetical protein
MTTFTATRLRETTAVAWFAEHRVRLTCAAVGVALVGLGVLVDIRETRSAEMIPATPGEGLAAVTRSTSAVVAAPVDPAAAGFRMPPLSQYGEVTERPLFAPDRRAHQAAQAATATATLPFTLRGIVVESKDHYALVEEGSGAAAVSKRLIEGQSIGGGTVKEILRDRIVLNMNGGETVIRLFDPSTQDGKHTLVLPAGGHPSQMLPPESAVGLYTRPPTSGG